MLSATNPARATRPVSAPVGGREPPKPTRISGPSWSTPGWLARAVNQNHMSTISALEQELESARARKQANSARIGITRDSFYGYDYLRATAPTHYCLRAVPTAAGLPWAHPHPEKQRRGTCMRVFLSPPLPPSFVCIRCGCAHNLCRRFRPACSIKKLRLNILLNLSLAIPVSNAAKNCLACFGSDQASVLSRCPQNPEG